MSTITEARPSTRLSNDGDKPVMNHYHRKDDITRAIVTGEKILALCGQVSTIRARGNGSVAQRTRGVLILCADCKRVYDGMPPGRA
jgi:hypothetical protein